MMKRAIQVFAVVVLGLAGIAVWAGPNPDPTRKNYEQFIWIYPQQFNQQVLANYIDAGTLKTTTLIVNSVSLTVSGQGSVTYDFPSLTGTQAAENTLCATSSAGTATGCALGDRVLPPGHDVARPNGFGSLEAYVTAANTFVVQACANGITDAGSFNMPDATYTVTCIR